jgi:uncharacterized protein YegP (UPF0339 family)
MASKKKTTRRRRSASRSRSLASLHAGDRVTEGTIVEVHNGAALVGREPTSDTEQPGTGETLVFVRNRRVFLAAGQAFIPLAALHRLATVDQPPPTFRPTSKSRPAAGFRFGTGTSEYHFTVYQDTAGGWRWRIQAANNRTVADSSESYASKANADRAVDDLNNTDWPIDVKG